MALHQAFDAPVMRAAKPQLGAILRATLTRPALWPALLPGRSLSGLLRRQFRNPRLAQLFARYATYVGGRPGHSPGVLALIWRAEAAGVWAVEGGMHRLALALAELAKRIGVDLRLSTPAKRIDLLEGRVSGVRLADGSALPPSATEPRSLSAWVWSFAATPEGPLARDLVHHNVFFPSDTGGEFGPLGRGEMPDTPTLYICAEDRAGTTPPGGPERFEIIVNAPAGRPDHPKDHALCHHRTFATLYKRGLWFTPEPGPQALTTPAMLNRLFPGSGGAIYGRSPEGTFATFQRPGARTKVPGLYLAGGGAHPGAGVPMAALSGQHAAEAVIVDLTSASKSGRTVMLGGIWTRFRTTGRAPYR